MRWLFLILVLGCNAPFTDTSMFCDEKLKLDLIGKRLVMNDETFWEFSEEDELTVSLRGAYAYPSSVYCQCQVATTKDGKNYLIGGLGMEYAKKGSKYVLINVNKMVGLKMRRKVS